MAKSSGGGGSKQGDTGGKGGGGSKASPAAASVEVEEVFEQGENVLARDSGELYEAKVSQWGLWCVVWGGGGVVWCVFGAGRGTDGRFVIVVVGLCCVGVWCVV